MYLYPYPYPQLLDTLTEKGNSNESIAMEIRVRPLFRFLGGLLIGNILFIAGTAIVYGILADVRNLSSVLAKPVMILVLSQFNLTSENTLATWYSSMVLLSTGSVALLCYLAGRSSGEQRAWNKGWLFLAFFFAFLSLDELGSLHENAGRLTSLDIFGTATWESVLLIPLGIVLMFLVIFAFKEVKWHSLAFWLMGAGAVLLLSIPVQEYIETRMWNSNYEGWTRPVSLALIEEGSELFAAMLFLAGMTAHLVPKSAPLRTAAVQVRIDPLHGRRILAMLFFVFILVFVFVYTTGDYLGSDDGIAINWFPSSLALVLFPLLLLLRLGQLFWVLTYLVLLSGYYGSNFYSLIHWDQIALLSYPVRMVMLAGLVYFAFTLSMLSRDAGWRVGHLFGSLLIGSGFVIAHPLVTVPVVVGLMVLVYLHISRVREG